MTITAYKAKININAKLIRVVLPKYKLSYRALGAIEHVGVTIVLDKDLRKNILKLPEAQNA